MTPDAPRTHRPQHIVPKVRAAQTATDGYQVLACQVVRQSLDDALLPAQRADVLSAVTSGALRWWLDLAGVDERYHERVLAAISARARAPLGLTRRRR